MRARGLFLACAATACTVNGVTKWPGKGGGGAATSSTSDEGGGGEVDGVAVSPAAGGAGLPAGIPGGLCSADNAQQMRDYHEYDGACWDPPGERQSARMPQAAIPGRRAMQPRATDIDAEIVWFDMPADGTIGRSYCPDVDGDRPDWRFPYPPYGEPGGFARYQLPDFHGQQLAAVLDTLDANDTPFCVTIRWDIQCEDGHGRICSQAPGPGEPIADDGEIVFVVAADITNEGKPDEERRLPAMTNLPTDQVLAELARRGFTNVNVVEDNVPCERGVVCDASPGSGFYAPDTEITLTVRKAKK